MDFTDPFHNTEENIEITGYEPVLGGQLAEKAVWVDEAKCIGCQYCVHVASNTFTVDEFHGRSRAIRQDGDSSDVIQEAIDCLLYTSPSPRDLSTSRMPSSA